MTGYDLEKKENGYVYFWTDNAEVKSNVLDYLNNIFDAISKRRRNGATITGGYDMTINKHGEILFRLPDDITSEDAINYIECVIDAIQWRNRVEKVKLIYDDDEED